MEKVFKKSLYVVMPILLFGINHLLWCYGQNSFNMNEWGKTTVMAAYSGFLFFGIGIVIAVKINEEID